MKTLIRQYSTPLGKLAAMFLVAAGTLAQMPAAEPAVAEGEMQLDTLAAGTVTYSNVTVVSRSPGQITIAHAKGLASVRVAELSEETQLLLGYTPPKERKKLSVESLSTAFAGQAEQTREARAKVEELIGQHGAVLGMGAMIALPLLYLFCCFLFHLVCRKAGVNSPVKVCIPILQFDPLFKAAGMSRVALFWFLSPLLFAVCVGVIGAIAFLAGAPAEAFQQQKLAFAVGGLQALLSLASVMTGFVWCFKICIARGKHAWLGVFLILPLTNFLMLCYLAFSGGIKSSSRPGLAMA